MSLLLLSILYMVGLGWVCPSSVHAVGTSGGASIVVGGDGGSANLVDLAGDIVATATSSAGNDTKFFTTSGPAAATAVSAVYGDSLARLTPDSSVMPPPDTAWYTVNLTNAGNTTDSMTLVAASVKRRSNGFDASDSAVVSFWNAAGSAQISSLTLVADSTGSFKVAVYVKATAPRNDTLDVSIKAVARGGAGGDTNGYVGGDSVSYAGDGDDTALLPVGVINRKPIANAGPDTAVVPGNTVPLSAAASTDPDNDTPLTYQWTQETGPAVSLMPASTIVNPSFLSDSTYTGNYVFRLTVTDPTGDSSIDTVLVSGGNAAPTANAGPDTSVLNNTTATLNGSASSDLNNDTLQFKWTKTVGPAATVQNDTQAVAQAVMTNKGVYQFMLRVNDASDTAYDTVQVTVLNTPPVAVTSPDTSRANNDTAILIGSASSDADAGDTRTYSWSQLAGPAVTIQNGSSETASVYMTNKGTYVFRLVVNDGTDTGSDTVVVTVLNTKPVALTSPDTTVTKKDTVFINASGSSDADADTLTYSWQQISGSGVGLSPSNMVVNPSFVSADSVTTYVFLVIVNDGTDTAIDTVSITAVNTPPVANAGPDSGILTGQSATLSGSASSDANGDPLTYTWTQVGGPVRTLTPGANVVNPAFVSDTSYIGGYTFTLVVSDGFDSSAPDTVIVSTSNIPPVANAGLDSSVVHPDTVTMSGAGSTDANGDTLTYIWTQISGPPVVLMPSSAVVNPMFHAGKTAKYIFQLQVADGTDTSAPDTIEVNALNTPPQANAGPDSNVASGASVQLSGSASSDTNGDTLSYAWTQTGGPGVTLSPNATVVNPSFTPTLSSTYLFMLAVGDGVDTTFDTVAVTVGAGAPARVGFLGDTHVMVDTAGMVTIQVVVRDANGNAVMGETVVFTQTHPGTVPIASLITNGSGQAQTPFLPGTSSSFYRVEVKVVSTGVSQNIYIYGDKLTILPVPSDTANLGKGWRMWSSNRTPSPNGISSVIYDDDFGSQAKVYEWQADNANNSSLNNKKYYTPGTIVRGDAYWIKDAEGLTIDVDGPQPTMNDTVNVVLDAGWNQVGSGQFYFVDWSSGVRFSKSGETTGPLVDLSPQQAKDSSLIKNAIYWWDENISNYHWGPDTTPLGTSLFPNVHLKPMAGFWMYAETDVVMTVLPKPVEPMNATEILNQAPRYLSALYGKQGKSGSEANWAIQLSAKSGHVEDPQNYIGVMPNADAAQKSSLFEPPAVASGYMTLGVRDPDQTSSLLQAASYAAPITTAKAWNVDIYSDLNAPVTISWDNLQSIPEQYDVYLVTPEGATVNMRKASSVVLSAAALQSQYASLKMAVGLPEYLGAFLAAPLSKDVTFVYPNPGPDATGLVFFKHNVTAGEVKLRIFDMGGKLVNELSGTASPIQWDTTNRFGQRVGSGVYIYILEANGNRLVDKLAIVR